MRALEDVLSRARVQATPEPDSKARVRQGLEAALLRAPARAAAPATLLLRRWAGRAFWMGVGLVVGIVGSQLYSRLGKLQPEAGVLAMRAQPVPAEPGAVPALSEPAAIGAAAPTAGAAPPVAPSEPPQTRAAGHGAGTPAADSVASSALRPAAPAAANPDHLRQALAALRRAQAALRAGHSNTALDEMALLDRRVPSGVLEEERTLTRVLAWCDAQRLDRAEPLARRLLAEYPDSVYAPRLRESCVGRARLLEEMRTRASKIERTGD
jgi:hypothetical protein